jgi:hypothetical protein
LRISIKENENDKSTTNDNSLNNYMSGYKNHHRDKQEEFIGQYHLNKKDLHGISMWVNVIAYRKEIIEATGKLPVYAGPCIRIVDLWPDNLAALDNALLIGKPVEVQDTGAYRGIMAAAPAGMVWEMRTPKRNELMIWSKTARWISTARGADGMVKDEAEVIWLKAFNPQFRVIGKELKEGEEYGRFGLTVYIRGNLRND